MTTAARPTFDTARGGTQRGEGNLSVLSKQYSSRDLPSHTKLKHRYFWGVLDILIGIKHFVLNLFHRWWKFMSNVPQKKL